jgi:hypothetical protein
MRKLLGIALLAGLVLIQGCGGGGGSSSDSAAAAPAPAAPAPSSNTIAGAAANVHPISVDSGLGGNVNLGFVSVTLCAPGNASNCQTIDNIVLDTGSSGLRVMSSALSATLALAPQSDANGNTLAECTHFVDGYTWGPVRLADLKLAGEQASSLPIQVIGVSGFPSAPARCAATGASKNSVQQLRANGILGLGMFRQDCGSACVQTNNRGIYYGCTATACAQTPVPLAQQVQNPVAMFAVNNNGVIIQLPAVPAGGAARLAGSLVFGIGTQANNGLGAATVVGVDPGTGNFTTSYNGGSYSASFLDSGSNGLFFQDNIPVCPNSSAAPGFYCPAATLDTSAVIQGANGANASISFSIGNASTLLAAQPTFAAFGEFGGSFVANSFDWGLPFFYGRNVYTAIEGAATPAGAGPYVAF